MWPFKKKEVKEKEFHYVERELTTLVLSSYVVKIHNEAGAIIGTTCFTDSVLKFDALGNYRLDKDSANKPGWAEVDKTEFNRFQYFLQQNILTFEDFDYNQVSIATNIIKKVVIENVDSWEEQIQTYKWVEKE